MRQPRESARGQDRWGVATPVFLLLSEKTSERLPEPMDRHAGSEVVIFTERRRECTGPNGVQFDILMSWELQGEIAVDASRPPVPAVFPVCLFVDEDDPCQLLDHSLSGVATAHYVARLRSSPPSRAGCAAAE